MLAHQRVGRRRDELGAGTGRVVEEDLGEVSDEPIRLRRKGPVNDDTVAAEPFAGILRRSQPTCPRLDSDMKTDVGVDPDSRGSERTRARDHSADAGRPDEQRSEITRCVPALPHPAEQTEPHGSRDVGAIVAQCVEFVRGHEPAVSRRSELDRHPAMVRGRGPTRAGGGRPVDCAALPRLGTTAAVVE